MNRILAFSARNLKELLRDPLSYIFCLGFPLVMLAAMTLINESIPPQANMTLFEIDKLSGGIAVFALSFIMLFSCLSIAKDASGSFLTRLYASPMTSADFIFGYTLPMLALAAAQILITLSAGFIVSLFKSQSLDLIGIALCAVSLLPCAFMFISMGLLFGCVFSYKSAPALCSVVLSLSSFLGGIWFDADAAGGVLLKICKALPFYHAVKAAHLLVLRQSSGLFGHILVVCIYAAVFAALSAAAIHLRSIRNS